MRANITAACAVTRRASRYFEPATLVGAIPFSPLIYRTGDPWVAGSVNFDRNL